MSNTNDFIIENGILKKYAGRSRSVEFPGEITAIGEGAFSKNAYITSVVIPEGVTSIGDAAFFNCKNLTSVVIPESVTSINSEAFIHCDKLTSVVLPKSVSFIGNGAFKGCKGTVDKDGFGVIGNTIVSYHGTDTDIVIPDGITVIEGVAFHNQLNITTVTIPESVTLIGDFAFSGCANLKSVIISEGVTSIGAYAFADCKNLNSIVIPKTVKSIGGNAFSRCANLISATIPEGVSYIEDHTFYGCEKLTSVVIPESVTKIGNNAFYDCYKLTNVVIPTSVTSIEDCAFYACRELKSIVVPEGVTGIGERAFTSCLALSEAVIPSSVTAIGEAAFSSCRNANILIHANADAFDNNLFINSANDYAPKSIAFPAVPFSAFAAKLKPAAALGFVKHHAEYQPDVAETYKNYCFRNRKEFLPIIFEEDCVAALEFLAENNKLTATNFESEYFEPATAANASNCVAFLLDWKQHHIKPQDVEKLAVRELTKDPYNATDMRKLWAYKKLPDGTLEITDYKGSGGRVLIPERIGNTPVTKLSEYCFGTPSFSLAAQYGRIAFLKNISEIVIPNSITVIGKSAFRGCPELTDIIIPESVATIGEGAFDFCKKLTSVTISEGVTTIEKAAFQYCENLTSVEIPKSVTSIGTEAFNGCKNLTSVIIPEGVAFIGKGAFCGCENLTSATIPKGVTGIEEETFLLCSNLASVDIPDSVTVIKKKAFSCCNSLTSVVIPDSVTVIEDEAFSSCSNLTSAVIPKSVVSIGAEAFSACKGEEDSQGFAVIGSILVGYRGADATVVIPDNITAIESRAFLNQEQLVSVMLPDSVTAIGYGAFANCFNLTKAVIPESVASIGNLAFLKCEKLTIHAPAGSYAEAYAKENSIPFNKTEPTIRSDEPEKKSTEVRACMAEDGWSVCVPEGFEYSIDPAKNGIQAAGDVPYGIVIAKADPKNGCVTFTQPYENLVSFVTHAGGNTGLHEVTLDVAEAESALRSNIPIYGNLDWKTVKSTPHLRVLYRLWQVDKENHIVTYKVLIVTSERWRCCDLMLCDEYAARNNQEELVQQILQSVECCEVQNNDVSSGATVANKAEEARKQDEAAEAARRAEEARKQAEAAEAARKAEEERIQEEASRLNAVKAKSETTEEIDPIAEERRRLLKERKRQMRIIENNKGLFALFGEKARKRKAAEAKIEQINKELARLRRRK